MKCPITNKDRYVKEEDCHCFCCGVHTPESAVSIKGKGGTKNESTTKSMEN